MDPDPDPEWDRVQKPGQKDSLLRLRRSRQTAPSLQSGPPPKPPHKPEDQTRVWSRSFCTTALKENVVQEAGSEVVGAEERTFCFYGLVSCRSAAVQPRHGAAAAG